MKKDFNPNIILCRSRALSVSCNDEMQQGSSFQGNNNKQKKKKRKRRARDVSDPDLIEEERQWLASMKEKGFDLLEGDLDAEEFEMMREEEFTSSVISAFAEEEEEEGVENAQDDKISRPHIPVMLEQVVEAFTNPISEMDKASGRRILVDCTLGAGGHAAALLEAFSERGESIHFIGIDQDETALQLAGDRLSSLATAGDHKIELLRGNFGSLPKLLKEAGLDSAAGNDNGGCVDGILADLGVSSMQLDRGDRGFSFRKDAPLDMRMDQRQELSAWHIVNEYPEGVISEILRTFGEVKPYARVARMIVVAREKKPINTTEELIRAIAPALRWAGKARRWHHPATLPFQGIRMAVNNELRCLRELVESAPTALKPGGTLAIISFHGLEDGLVKRFLKKDPKLHALTKRPLAASARQIEENPRCRSSKLRIARRLHD